ncbi:MAG TPA: SWIM zinc finger family protein [Thermomicrobiales bacterium]|nr:SWIM zinc finger family protein [Thermomicrobiales bacterium]
MELTVEQALALAPDAAAATAGRKLGTPRGWRNLGRSDAALWGECQGSALYQVRVALDDLTAKCSCPSRKFPCKHAIGLLVLAASDPAALTDSEPPAWVDDWLARRAASAKRREAGPSASAPAPSRAKGGTAQRADRREARVAAGLDALDLWLDDLIRNGLAGVESRPATFWEAQAARLVDSQAPGLAARLRRMAAIPNATPDWPARLLDRLGRLALLTHAYRRQDDLDSALREDVRAAVGWSLREEEVVARGEVVRDGWLVLGQRVTIEDRLRTQATWLVGARSGRPALALQFAHGSAPFAQTLAPGTRLDADLVYWPGAYPLRALVRERHGAPAPLAGPLPGPPTIDAFLDGVAAATARQPWLDRFPCVLNGVTPLRDDAAGWLMRDRDGAALPLTPGEHWRLLALGGGRPLDLAGEWDGTALTPLGAWADGAYHLFAEVR